MEKKLESDNQIRSVLKDEFQRIKGMNPNYSLRSFAKRLGFSPSVISEIMNGRRKITKKTGLRILHSVRSQNSDISKLIRELESGDRKSRSTEERIDDKEYVLLQSDRFNLISDWFYFAVLSLAETEDFNDDPKWISKRLKLSLSEARQAISVLKRLGFLIERKGKLVPSGVKLRTTTDIPSAPLRASHFQNLDLAAKSLTENSLFKRDFSSVTMCIDPEKLPEAKRRIKKFRRELCEFMESGEKKDVYKLCIQFFPLTREGV